MSRSWRNSVSFYCHVISCALARRDVQRNAAEASDSGEKQRKIINVSFRVADTMTA